ncbi:exonuclease mut-7 homolog, partial [Uloborus diversus]|uniref:exonuclease mut-7 homolog n=1 Tax=Uloborus diversus TaxID=327109 RepID=UPI0024092895
MPEISTEKSTSLQLTSDLRRSEMLWKKYRKPDILRKFLHSCYLKNAGSLNYITNLICLACDRYSNAPDLVHNMIVTYQQFLEEKCIEFSPTFEEKLEVLNYVVSCKNYQLVQLVCCVYKINEERDRFKSFIQDLLVHRKLSEAAFCIRAMNLHHEYPMEKVILPLLFEGIVHPVIIYLSDHQEMQLAVVKHIDSLIDMKATDPSSPEFKKSRKLFKTLNTLVNVLKIPPEACKNLHYFRSRGALYVLIKRRLDQSIAEDVWEEMVMQIVQKNEELKQFLVNILMSKNDIKTAMKMAEKLNITVDCSNLENANVNNSDLEDFQNEDIVELSESENNTKEDNLCEHLEFPLSLSDIKLISYKEDFIQFIDEIKKYKMVGIDSEWKPQFGLSRDRLSLIQLAVHDKVFILDILALDKCLDFEDWDLLTDDVFGNSNIVKLGCGIMSDVNMILENHKGTKGKTIVFSHILDMAIFYQKLQEVYPEEMNSDASDNTNQKGLSKLCEIILGKPLNKEERLCDWEKRPLKETQLAYAALDAYCLLQMYDTLRENALQKNMNFDHLSKVAIVLTTSLWKSKKKIKGSKHQHFVKAETIIPIEQFKVVTHSSFENLGKQLRQYGADVLVLKSSSWLQDMVKISNSEKRIILCSSRVRHLIRGKFDKDLCFVISDEDEESTSVFQIFHHFNVQLSKQNIFSRCIVCNSEENFKLTDDDVKFLKENELADNFCCEDNNLNSELLDFVKNACDLNTRQNIFNSLSSVKEAVYLCKNCG